MLSGHTIELLGRGRTHGPLRLQHNGLTIESTEAVDLVVTRVTFVPGGATGWQSHPGPVLIIVGRGSLTRYSADDANAQTYTSGHAFVHNDPNDGSVVRNEGSVDAEAIVTFVGPPQGEP
jgi:hypothetical protein